MRRWNAFPLSGSVKLPALVGLLLALTACGPPAYRFTANDADSLVVKIPRGWSLVRSGVPASSDGTPSAAGNWFAVYDGASHPTVDHVGSAHALAPVALVQTSVLDADQGRALTDDDMRDALLPVSEKGRAVAQLRGGSPGNDFHLISDEKVGDRTAAGVHVVFSYDLGQGPEVFDQVVMADQKKTRIHLLLVHCSQSCYDRNRGLITDSVRSFTVRPT
jgi:hypothetical protein